MNLKSSKLEENNICVIYKFETNAWIPSLNADEKTKGTHVTKYGFCSFNKITEKFKLDKEKSDPYFFYESSVRPEVNALEARLITIKRKNLEFPDFIAIITG